MIIRKKITKFNYTENEIIQNINLFIKDKCLKNNEVEEEIIEKEEKNKIFISDVSFPQDIPKINDNKINNKINNKIIDLDDNSLNLFNELVSYNEGYLYELYDIYCYNLNWLTGWEISKKIYDKIINNNKDAQYILEFTSHGYFGNIDDNLLLGFLYCISSLSKNTELKYNYFIYDNNNIQNVLNNNGKIIDDNYRLKFEEDKQFTSTTINYINSVDELEYSSPSICRYVNNNLQMNTIYLNFSIVNTNNLPRYNIKNILHSIMKLNNNECMLILSLSEYINFDTILYIYFLNCIFEEIELVKYPWDNMIWVFCYKRKFSINKKIFTELMENFNLVEKEDLNDELKLSKLNIIQDELEEFKDNILHDDLTIEKWMSSNELILERISSLGINS